MLGSSTSTGPDRTEVGQGLASTWDAMVHRHYSFVYRRCLLLTHNQPNAVDLTQETVINVLRGWSTYRPGNVHSRLNRILTKLFLDQVRRRDRATFYPFYPLFDTDIPVTAGTVASPIELVTDRILEADVAAAPEAVTPAFRTVDLLNDVAGVRRDEIPQLLSVEPARVSTRRYRACEQLRKSLAPSRRPVDWRTVRTEAVAR